MNESCGSTLPIINILKIFNKEATKINNHSTKERKKDNYLFFVIEVPVFGDAME